MGLPDNLFHSDKEPSALSEGQLQANMARLLEEGKDLSCFQESDGLTTESEGFRWWPLDHYSFDKAVKLWQWDGYRPKFIIQDLRKLKSIHTLRPPQIISEKKKYVERLLGYDRDSPGFIEKIRRELGYKETPPHRGPPKRKKGLQRPPLPAGGCTGCTEKGP
jgi:hypothetical protein